MKPLISMNEIFERINEWYKKNLRNQHWDEEYKKKIFYTKRKKVEEKSHLLVIKIFSNIECSVCFQFKLYCLFMRLSLKIYI